MRKGALALIALALAATLVGADEWPGVDVEKLIEDAPDKEDYPDASAVILNIQETTEVAEDGSSLTTRNKLIKMLTLRGRERYSNQSFYYNTDEESLELVKGVTIRKSGRVVEVEEDGINDVTPAFLEGATIYANVLEKVISFPVAGPGSTIELQLLEKRKASEDGSFSGIEYMGAKDPVLHAEFRLRYPAESGRPAAVALPGLLGDVALEHASSSGELSWSADNLPALVEEDHIPPEHELLPRIIYSSYKTWDEPAAYLGGEFYPHVESDGAVAERVAELVDGLSSDEGRIRAIFLDVATNVRNVNLALGLGGYEPNDANTVLANKYGDTRDKAVLLISMLRAAGIDAYPAAVRSERGTFVESVPTLKQFTRLLVALPTEEGYRFLDPFLDDVSYGYLRWGRGNTALVVKPDGSGELVQIPPFDPEENVARRTMSIFLSDDGSAFVRVVAHLTGYFDRKARKALKDATPDEKERLFDKAANAVSAGATNVEYNMMDMADLTSEVRITQSIEAPDFAVVQGDMMIVRIPEFPYEFAGIDAYPTLVERRYPFEIPCEATSRLEVKVVLPKGWDVARVPESLSIEGDVADFELISDWYERKQSIMWLATVTLKKKRIAVDEYAAFKEGYDAVASPKNRLVLLKKKHEAELTPWK